jgi:hypothetical protein
VHQQTKTLANAHKNIGFAMADLSEACSHLHVVITMQEILENAQSQRDWDRFFPCLEELSSTLAYVESHPALSLQSQLTSTIEEVQSLAIDCLQAQYMEMVESIPVAASVGAGGAGMKEAGVDAGKDDKARDQAQRERKEKMEKVSKELIRLRGALVAARCDIAPDVLQQLRSELVSTALLRAQRNVESNAGGRLGQVAQVPANVLIILLFERLVFASVLVGGVGGVGGGEEAEPKSPIKRRGGRRRGEEEEDGEGTKGEEEVKLSAEAAAAFRLLCSTAVKLLVGIVEKALEVAAKCHLEFPAGGAGGAGGVGGAKGAGGGGASSEWGVYEPIARRFEMTLSLLDLHAELKTVLSLLALLVQKYKY